MSLKGKVILVTGGTGSFGRKFVEVALRYHEPERIRIYSRGELLQSEMERQLNDERLRFFIGDVRDRNRVYRAMSGVDIVVHAAALKQVPACEYNPIEAIRTNIEGAINIIDAAIDNGVSKLMDISTDKAVHPVNLYGATKAVAEKLFVHGNAYTGGHKTKLSCVRYGNVMGSRGSIIPIFSEQKKDGSITITDERMTRFWITPEQGARFVIDCINRMHGGEIFVPKIPSMKVTDLADIIAPDAERRIIGIRPGEKLDEILLTEEEARHAKEFENCYIIEPEHRFWSVKEFTGGKALIDNFSYTSDNNRWWLTKEEMKQLLEES